MERTPGEEGATRLKRPLEHIAAAANQSKQKTEISPISVDGLPLSFESDENVSQRLTLGKEGVTAEDVILGLRNTTWYYFIRLCIPEDGRAGHPH